MSNIIFILAVIAIFIIAYAALDYVNFTKDYCNQPEDKTGLYDFIEINDIIINVNNIVVIKSLKSIDENNYKIIIEFNDNKEPIIFDFDDFAEADEIMNEIKISLDCYTV